MKEFSPEQLLSRFSTHLRNVVAKSMALATSFEHAQVNLVHIIVAMLEEDGSIASEVLKKNNVEIRFLLTLLENKPKLKQNLGLTITAVIPELDSLSKQALERSILIAYEKGHNYVGTEHLLLGIFKGRGEDLVEIINKFKISKKELEREIESILQSTSHFPKVEDMDDMVSQMEDIMGEQGMPSPLPLPSQKMKKTHFSGLDLFTTNLTDKKNHKNIDPVIGREKEISRVINILSRRTKNNPVLVGEPGVGKTAIVEGLAKRIAEGQVPDILKNKKILSLDMTLLVAGTIYRGEFEARLKQIVDEITKSPNCILFIDELHNIIGAGSSQGAMDAANILKPALARGHLRCIGATTIDEYKKHINSDPALERRFQSIYVEEPSRDEAVEILDGIKKYYEDFHNVKITKTAIETAVDLSIKYIHDNFLPDKAIDLIDEASASVKTKTKSTPLEIKKQKLLEERDAYFDNKEQAISQEKFEQAIGWKKKIELIEKKLDSLQKQIIQSPKNSTKKVTENDIAKILEIKLDIPAKILLTNEWEELKTLAERLKNHIIGQNQAIDDVVKKISQAHLGLQNNKKPLCSFLFAGPSGVGKTELAKILAKELFHSDKALIKLDMSEFSEAHSTSKLLGSPAGYIGHKDRNHFTDEIRKRPYCVVLFDEIDKAHRDVNKLLLQILDEGTLTDSSGKKTNFRHTVIILTTNLGSELFKSAGIGFGKNENKQNKERNENITHKLKEELSPALLNRLTAIEIFSPLTKENIKKIVEKNLEQITQTIFAKEKINIKTNPTALDYLTRESFSDDYGARQVEKIIQDTVHELVIDILQKERRKKSYTLSKVKNVYKLI
ncbi:ATP-dependent Clp protease ATP-binding subunit [Patescibacteria group bacterium]|nr:ATP-dependent Clp protease ATP-binding subunit [Patescibacteria group bacterium]